MVFEIGFEMDINKSDLINSAVELGISNKIAEDLWNKLKETSEGTHSKLVLSHVLYYIGAMIVLIALGWFAVKAWINFEGKDLFFIAIIYMLSFLIIGNGLWHKKGLRIPGGLFLTLAVCLMPMAVDGFQKWTGFWLSYNAVESYSNVFNWVKGESFALLILTILLGCVVLAFYRFPFLLVPILVASIFLLLDFFHVLFKSPPIAYWMIDAWVFVGFGIVMIVVAYLMDLFIRSDFAFWGYLIGVASFWWGADIFNNKEHLNLFIYLVINIFLVLLAIILQRTVFLVFGTIGMIMFMTNLFGKYFGSDLFPVVLSLTGIVVIFMGIIYQKNRQKIDSAIHGLFSKNVRKWLPKPEKHTKI